MSKERAVVRTPSIRRVAVRISIYALVAVWGVVLLIQHLILRPETMDFVQVAFACFFVLAGAIQLRAITGSIRGVQYTFTDQRLILEQHGEKESCPFASPLPVLCSQAEEAGYVPPAWAVGWRGSWCRSVHR